ASGELVRHTARVPGGPSGASLRGRLLTISVHTVLSFTSMAAKNPAKIENPWLGSRTRGRAITLYNSHPPSPALAPYNVRACHSATLGSALIRQNLLYPLASLDVSGQ